MPTEIGSFETKTKFFELLRKVKQGETFTITPGFDPARRDALSLSSGYAANHRR